MALFGVFLGTNEHQNLMTLGMCTACLLAQLCLLGCARVCAVLGCAWLTEAGQLPGNCLRDHRVGHRSNWLHGSKDRGIAIKKTLIKANQRNVATKMTE